MENAEEVMQLLEEFSKTKPKDIPRKLEDYLCNVAKTGDPVFQWSLIKTLFREKLINVITEFYESTLTVELPPCPNVEPFNYDRVKASLIERFDAFTSAPFTVQRICELLTSPRKEYNRADKYMRAIEKNILVVSTREPGTAKRPFECDSQSEAILNGMPDVRIGESNTGLLHIPTDLPYLGAPPASNDITVETTEPNNLEVNSEKMNVNHMDLNCETKELHLHVGSEQSWQVTAEPTQEPAEKSHFIAINSETDNSIARPIDEHNCDTSNRPELVLANSGSATHSVTFEEESKGSSDSLPGSPSNNAVKNLPDSIGSTDSSTKVSSENMTQELPKRSEEMVQVLPTPNKIEVEELVSSDENEVSSTPADDVAAAQEEINDPTDSEAEATGSVNEFSKETESDVNLAKDHEVNSRLNITDSTKSPTTISEITATKSNDIDLECNEISGTVDSPVGSPESDTAVQSEDIKENNPEAGEEAEQCLHPDSSDDVSVENKISPEELSKSEQCSEADSMSDPDLQQSETRSDSEDAPDQTNQTVAELVNKDPSSGNLALDENSSEVCTSKTGDDDINAVSKSSDSSPSSEDSSRDETVDVKLTEVQSSTETKVTSEEERKVFELVTTQSGLSLTPDSQQQEVGIEEINVDPSCEAEEAMDVDDGSNQMMVTEGENEGEPMEQGDQHS